VISSFPVSISEHYHVRSSLVALTSPVQAWKRKNIISDVCIFSTHRYLTTFVDPTMKPVIYESFIYKNGRGEADYE